MRLLLTSNRLFLPILCLILPVPRLPLSVVPRLLRRALGIRRIVHDPEVVLGELKIALRRDPVSGGRGVAR
jgi:hypothetical protein